MSSVLVVDDEKSIRESLTIYFQDKGFEIDTAGNGMEALSCLYAKHYDVVLSDVRMPCMDGIRLLDAVREHWFDLPVILLSAYITDELLFLVKKAGVHEVVTKPYSLQTLSQAVETALTKKISAPEPTLSPSRLDDELQKKILELKALDTIQVKLRGASNHKTLFQEALQHLRAIVDFDYAVAALYDLNGKECVVERVLSETCPLTVPHHIMLDSRLLPSVARANRPFVISRIQENPDVQKQYRLRQGSLLALPLLTDCAWQGGLLMYTQSTTEEFTVEKVRLTTIILNSLGLQLDNQERRQRLTSCHTDAVQSLFAVLEAKDAATYDHSAKVACYALLIARQLGLPEHEFRNLEYLALLHDIGKVSLPDTLLAKHGELTEEEAKLWQSHTAMGAAILEPISFIPGGDLIVLHHHEHFDGSGYPDGLKGNAIPLYSRVIAIADGFVDQLEKYPTQNRSVHKELLENMMQQAGKKYDPEMLDLFLKSYTHLILTEKKENPPEPD